MKEYTIPAVRKNLECGFDPKNIASGREPCQMGWYEFVSDLILSKAEKKQKISILDVGCGMFTGIHLMRQKLPKGSKIIGQDIDKNLSYLDSNFIFKDISKIKSKSFDYVTCFDVIEHVEYDLDFFNDLKRLCKKELFITTPNYTRSKAQNHCHCREYTIPQFVNFFIPDVLWVASPDGFTHRTQLLKKDGNNYIDLTRKDIIYKNSLSEDLSFCHSTVDGMEWPHYLGIFNCI